MGCMPHLGFARETLVIVGALRCAGGMGSELSMATRREITKKYAREYATAAKKERGRMLDALVATTGWSRANARRQVQAASERKGPQRAVRRTPRPRTYGYDTLRLLIRIWMLAGQPSGKYLAATMALWLPKLEQHGEFGEDTHRLDDHTRAQLLTVSGATIDRLLKPTRDGMRLTGISGTKPGPLLRNSIQVRKAGDEHEQAPGFCELDLVLHCGPTLKGEFCRSLTVTCVHTGWTENRALKNGAHRWVLEAMPLIEQRLPFPLIGIDSDNGGEFINDALINWAGERDLFFTRARPYHSWSRCLLAASCGRRHADPRPPRRRSRRARRDSARRRPGGIGSRELLRCGRRRCATGRAIGRAAHARARAPDRDAAARPACRARRHPLRASRDRTAAVRFAHGREAR